MRDYKEMYKYEQYTGTHEFTKGKLERHTGGPGRIRLQTVCWGSMLKLRHSNQLLGESTRSKLHDLDMRIQGSQMKLPRRVMRQKPSGEHSYVYRQSRIIIMY